jgi:hypothetical protein
MKQTILRSKLGTPMRNMLETLNFSSVRQREVDGQHNGAAVQNGKKSSE